MAEAQAVVFVIDDDQSVRDGLKGLLRAIGLEVKLFGSIVSAEREADVQGCLVLDIRLPGMGGLDFQRELQNRASIFQSSSSPVTATFP